MFERFTAGSQRVIILTQEECRLLRHDCITPAHLLLGLLAEGGGVAAQALATLGVSLERARDVVADLVAPGEVAPIGKPDFSEPVRRALELSQREALQLGSRHIGTEHILLGLVRLGDSTVSELLRLLEVDPARVPLVIRVQTLSDVPAVSAAEVTIVEAPPHPSVLLLASDVEEVLRAHGFGVAVRSGEQVVEGLPYLWSLYRPLEAPWPRLAVAAAEVTVEAFDRYSGELTPEFAAPVDGLADRATFDRQSGMLRVLSGSTLFVIIVPGAPSGSLEIASALARKVLARLRT